MNVTFKVTFITPQLATSGVFTSISLVYIKTRNTDPMSCSASTLRKQCQLSPKPQICLWTLAESFLAEQLLRFLPSWGGHVPPKLPGNSGRPQNLLSRFTANSTNLSSTKPAMRFKIITQSSFLFTHTHRDYSSLVYYFLSHHCQLPISPDKNCLKGCLVLLTLNAIGSRDCII